MFEFKLDTLMYIHVRSATTILVNEKNEKENTPKRFKNTQNLNVTANARRIDDNSRQLRF